MKYVVAVVLAAVGISCSAQPRARSTGGEPGWQAAGSSPAPAPARKAQHEMVEVEGDYCPNLEEECMRWLDPETKLRCEEFRRPTVCRGGTTHKHFFIDRYEYPNVAGEKPVLMVTWYEAKAACDSMGKRLCTASEWTLACEGQERSPYPYGYRRDGSACNIDHDTRSPNQEAFRSKETRDAEVARLDQRTPSGSMGRCVSPFGVHDMTGNVDEWVVNEQGHKDRAPYESGLKGGYWGPVRTRCRPMTTAHGPTFAYYQIGFRCCMNAD